MRLSRDRAKPMGGDVDVDVDVDDETDIDDDKDTNLT